VAPLISPTLRSTAYSENQNVYRHITSSLRVGAALMLMLAAPVMAMASDIVVVMGVGAASLTRDQLADIYLGRNAALKPLDLPESNSLRDAFYKKALDRDAAQVKAVWSRIIFTGQGQPPKELPDASAVKQAVAADPKLIGYIDKSDLDATVKVVLTLP
jgi:ABC-type phosphate transport system substrate-binding protein